MLLPFFLSLFTFIINSSSLFSPFFFFYFQLYKQFLSSYLIQFFLLFTLFTLPLFSSHHSVFFYLLHYSLSFLSSYLTVQFLFNFLPYSLFLIFQFFLLYSLFLSSYLTIQLFTLFTLTSHISVFFSTFYIIHSSNHSFFLLFTLFTLFSHISVFSTFYIVHSSSLLSHKYSVFAPFWFSLIDLLLSSGSSGWVDSYWRAIGLEELADKEFRKMGGSEMLQGISDGRVSSMS